MNSVYWARLSVRDTLQSYWSAWLFAPVKNSPQMLSFWVPVSTFYSISWFPLAVRLPVINFFAAGIHLSLLTTCLPSADPALTPSSHQSVYYMITLKMWSIDSPRPFQRGCEDKAILIVLLRHDLLFPSIGICPNSSKVMVGVLLNLTTHQLRIIDIFSSSLYPSSLHTHSQKKERIKSQLSERRHPNLMLLHLSTEYLHFYYSVKGNRSTPKVQSTALSQGKITC